MVLGGFGDPEFHGNQYRHWKVDDWRSMWCATRGSWLRLWWVTLELIMKFYPAFHQKFAKWRIFGLNPVICSSSDGWFSNLQDNPKIIHVQFVLHCNVWAQVFSHPSDTCGSIQIDDWALPATCRLVDKGRMFMVGRYVYMYIYGGFHKWWYPKMEGF